MESLTEVLSGVPRNIQMIVTIVVSLLAGTKVLKWLYKDVSEIRNTHYLNVALRSKDKPEKPEKPKKMSFEERLIQAITQKQSEERLIQAITQKQSFNGPKPGDTVRFKANRASCSSIAGRVFAVGDIATVESLVTKIGTEPLVRIQGGNDAYVADLEVIHRA